MVAPVQSVVRAFAVLGAFGPDTQRQNLAQVSQRTGLARGTAHRLLSTLEDLGYVRNDDGIYELTHRLLDLGHGYLTSQPLPELSRLVISRVSEDLDEHASVAVLDGTTALVVAATPVRHRIALSTHVGSRLPLAPSASGRALLSATDQDVVRALLVDDASASDIADLLAETVATKKRGFSVADESLESGVVSVAVPIRDPNGSVVAAVAVAAPKARYRDAALHDHAADRLLVAAREIESGLAFRS